MTRQSFSFRESTPGHPVILLAVLALSTLVPAGAAHGADPFHTVLEPYEAIRLALLEDSMDGVADNAAEIVAELEALSDAYSAEAAGVHGEYASDVQAAVDEALAAARRLEEASEIEPARTTFYELTKPLVRWRDRYAGEDLPNVAFCPMYERSWLQPGEQIGNPYGDMPRCGSIVPSGPNATAE